MKREYFSLRKPVRILLFAAIVVVLGGFGLSAFLRAPSGPRDLVYAGKPVSYWVRNCSTGAYYHDGHIPLDSNAVPYLVWVLNRRDGKLSHAYAKIWLYLPGWLRTHVSVPRDAIRDGYGACLLLGDMGPGARPAIPALIRVIQEDAGVMRRIGAADALGRIASRDDRAVVDALFAASRTNSGKYSVLAIVSSNALLNLDSRSTADARVKNVPTGLHHR